MRAALGILLSVLVLASCGERTPVLIGFIGGLSGHAADLGTSGLNGARLAIEAQNRNGGINGHPIQLVAEDDKQDADAARDAFQRLAGRQVAAIIGPMTSVVAMTIVPLADEKHLLLVSPTVTTRALTGRDDYLVRVIADTGIYAEASARFHAEKRHIGKFAVLYDADNQAYADSWSEDFRQALEQHGGKVVLKLPFRATATADFDRIAAEAASSGAEAVLILGSSVDAALMAQQIRQIDGKIQLVTSEWAATERLTTLGGSAVEGVFTAQFVDRESEQPAYQQFRKLYVERFQQEPGFSGVAGYDAANTLITALRQRHNGETVREAILRMADFQGVQSPIHIDKFGDSTRPTYITVIRNGKYLRVD
jgi:branched-chain amino acid transport system substrate-binding protein